MEMTENYLQILSESLDKKIVILEELNRLTEVQKSIVSSEEFDDSAFEDNINKKSGLINEVQNLDKGFEMLYNNIKQQIEGNKEQYRSQIAELQTKIKKVLDDSTSLQVAEASNKRLIESRCGSMKKEVYQVKKSRDMAASYYRTMNNITTEPYFMDKKQ